MGKWACRGLIILMLGISVLQHAEAGEPENKEAKRAQMRLRKLEQEKSQLSQEKAQVEEKLKAAETAADAASRRAEGTNRRLVAVGKELDAMRQERDALTGKLTEMDKRLQEEKQAHANDKKRLEALAGRQLSAIGACRERNEKMYEFGNQLVDRYEAKGCFSAVLQAEPFTGLARARIEAMAEEDRSKLDDLRLPPESAQSADVGAASRRN